MNQIICNCGKELETDFPEIFDAADHPNLIEDLLNGDFMSLTCSSCGVLIKPELPVRIIDKRHGMDFLFRPEQERRKYLAGKLDLPEAGRITFGYMELAEKVLIFSLGLNDRVLECIKYFYLKKAGTDTDVTIYLDGIDDDNLQFRIHGLREDEIGIAHIGLDFYKSTERDFDDILLREDIEEIVTPPFVSINKVYLGED